MQRRSFMTGAVAASACATMGVASPPPLVPFATAFTYYDHGWIAWTPTHPEFESIEAQIIDARAGAPAFIRVFFSRREGDKSQVFYFTDSGFARGWTTGTAHVADIAYAMTGAPGGPRGLEVRFADAGGAPVTWTMQFAPDATLHNAGAGLRASVGHSRDLIFSLPVRGPTAIATASRLTIGDADYSMAPQPRPEFRDGVGAGYNQGEATSLLLLAPQAVRAQDGALLVNDRRFAIASGGADRAVHRWENRFGARPGAIELETRGSALAGYRHLSGDHEWRFDFPEPLPAPSALRHDALFPMRMSWDGRALVEATLQVEQAGDSGARLRWRAATPVWLGERQLMLDIEATADGYRTSVSRA